MTVSLLTKSRSHAPVTLAAAALVLQPPRHLTMAPLLLLPGQYHVGSDPDCALVLDAAGIAPQHLLLVVGPHGIGLRALDSRTWVNDFLVRETSLRRGDRISVGPLTVTLRAATPDDVLTQVPAAMTTEPVVEARPSKPLTFASVDARLEQVQADLAAAQAVEIDTPEIVVGAESINESTTSTHEIAIPETQLPVVEAVIAEAAAIEAFAARVAAWESDCADQERHFVEKAHDLAIRAASLDESEAQVAAWKSTRADQERRLAERVHELTLRAASFDEREASATAREKELAEQARRFMEQADALAARAIGLDERETRLTALESEHAEQEQHLTEKILDLATRAAGLEEREARLTAFESRLVKREEILDQRQTEFDAQRTAIDYREATLTEERLRLEAVAAEARTELAAESEKQTAAWEEWETAQRKLAATLNDQFADIREAEARLATEKAALEAEQQANESARQSWETERGEWDARRRQQQLELAQWEAEAYQQRNDLSQQVAQFETQRADVHAEVCQRAAAHRELFEARQETQRERRLFAEQQSAWMTERESQWNELRDRRRRIDADEREIAELQLAARDTLAQLERDRTALAANPPTSTAASIETPPPEEMASIAIAEDQSPLNQLTDAVSEPEIVAPNAVDDVVIDAASTETEGAPFPSWAMMPVPATDADFTFASLQERFNEQPIEPVQEPSTLPPPGWAQAWTPPTEFSPASDPLSEVTHPIAASSFEAGSLAQSLMLALRPAVESHEIPEDAELTNVIAESPPVPETTEIPSEETAADEDLHARLAKMFGLPQDFGHQDAADEDQTSSNEIVAIEPPDDVAIATETTEESEPPATTGGDADEAWRARLAMMLAESPVDPLPPRDVIPAHTAPVEPTQRPVRSIASSPPPSAATAEEDSIAAYMERLLMRNNMGSSSVEIAPPFKPTPHVVPEPMRTIELPVRAQEDPGDFADEELPPKPVAAPALENKTRVDKDEVRAALQSFREVANLSARSALAKHSSKTLRGELVVQGVLTGLASVAALGYWCGPLFGASMQPLHGTGCLIAAGVMGWQISRSLNRLKNWNPDDVLLSEVIQEDEESITELLVQVDAAIEEVAGNEVPANIPGRTEVSASDDQTPSLQEPTGVEPMSRMIGPC